MHNFVKQLPKIIAEAARSQRSHPPFGGSADSVTFPPNFRLAWAMSCKGLEAVETDSYKISE